jgi:hypothetical protein
MKKSILEIVLLTFAVWCFVSDTGLYAQRAAVVTKDIPKASVRASSQSAENTFNSSKASVKQPCTVKPYIKGASCTGRNDGAIELEHLSGTPPYKYEWSSGARTQSVDSLHAGVYTVKVTDATGCISNLTINVLEESEMSAKVNVYSASAKEVADGGFDVVVNGGNAPYIYMVSDFSNFQSVRNLKQENNKFEKLRAGRYIVNVVDTRGCMASVSLIIRSLDSK